MKVLVDAFEAPFQKNEAHFSEITFFNNLEEHGKVMLAHPPGVPLPIWEEAYEQTLKNSMIASTSTNSSTVLRAGKA